MRLSRAAVLAVCLGAAAPAGAAVCEASYQADGRPATRYFDLGEVTGALAKKNCLAKAKNDLGNRKSSEVGLVKGRICDGPVAVSVFTRLSSKERPDAPEAVVKVSFAAECPKPAPAEACSPAAARKCAGLEPAACKQDRCCSWESDKGAPACRPKRP